MTFNRAPGLTLGAGLNATTTEESIMTCKTATFFSRGIYAAAHANGTGQPLGRASGNLFLMGCVAGDAFLLALQPLVWRKG